jgi:hypothetical protein
LCPGAYFDSTDLSVEINWGDGTTEILSDLDPTVKTHGKTASHVYDTAGVKWVIIKGGFLHDGTRKLAFSSSDDITPGCDISNIERITKWPNFYVHGQGDFKAATKLQSVPANAVNLIKSTDPLSSIVIGGDKIALNETFMDCPAFNTDLNSWDITGCISLNSTFKNASSFDGWIKLWDVSDVTTMASTFEGATNFNQDCLGDWRVDKVTDMSNLFKDCKFDGFIANWFRPGFQSRPNIFVIENMSGMFSGTSEMGKKEASGESAGSKFMFRWKLDSVKDMSSMFKDNKHWNSWIQTWFKDETKTFAVTNMSRMFENSVFNLGLSWNVKSVEDMSYMFKDAAFNNFLCNWFRPAGGWNSNAPRNLAIKNIKGMFSGDCKYGADGDPKKGGQFLFRWDLQTVEDASEVFKDNQNWTHWIESWFNPVNGKSYNVTTMASMFENTIFNSKLSKWDLSSVTDISNMFKNATFDKYIANWDLTSCTNVSGLFSGPDCKFKDNADALWKWDLSAVEDASYMFKDNSEFDSTAVNTWFKQNSTNNRVLAIQSVKGMFEGNTKFNSALGNWDLRTVTDASDMFKNNQVYTDASATNLFKSAGWKTYQIQDMSGMFSETSLNPDLSTWDMGTVTSTKNMFKNNTGFNGWINGWFKQDAGSTKVFNIQDMSGMFENSVQTTNISDWDVSTVVDMTNMFKNAQFDGFIKPWFKQNAGGDKVFACKYMTGMFSGSNCKFGQGNQSGMSSWDINGVDRVDYMFHDNPHFDAWLKSWKTNTTKSNINFSNNNDWTTTPWIPNDRSGGVLTGQSKLTDDIDINQSSSSTGSIKIWDTDGLFDDLIQISAGDPTSPGEVVISTQPTRGDVTLEFTGANLINWTYNVDYKKGAAAGTDTFTLKYTDSNNNISEQDVTINLISEPWTVAKLAPAADPVEVEFRWKEITVSESGESVNVTVLQAKNLLTPTNSNWTNDTTGWWTLYGYAGDENLRSSYTLGTLSWPDAAVQATYGSFHDTTVTLPEGGTVTMTAGDNTGYLQLHYSPDGDYEFNGDVSAGNGELFMFFGDTDDDSGTVSPDWPLPRKTAISGPVPLVPATPQSATGTGNVTGDITKELMAGPAWDGYIYGDIYFTDMTYGSSYASNSDAQNNGYVSVVGTPTATNTTGGIQADVYYEWNTSGMRWSFYVGDGYNWRGDGTFTIEWINDRSAQLQEDDANGMIPGGYASYSDPTNGVSFTAWNEGADYNMSIVADGTSEMWQLLSDNGAWEGFEYEYDFGNSTGSIDQNEGWSTHVYPSGTVIDITGGSDPGLAQGTDDYDHAYNQKNSIEIRLRVSDAVDGGPGGTSGDTDVSIDYTQGYYSGMLSFSDTDGISKLSDPNYGGWYSAGSMAKPGTTPRGTFNLRKNSPYDTGMYDYSTDTQGIFPYVDEFQVTWQDDLGYTNTSDVKFTVSAPADQVGQWMGQSSVDVPGQNPSSWIDPENDPNGEAVYISSSINLSDNDGVYNNEPTVTAQPTKGSVEVSKSGSDMQVDYYPGASAGFTGPETDTASFEWIDDMGHSNTITFTFNISQYVDIFANPTGITGSVNAWENGHPSQGQYTYASGDVIFPNIDSDWMVSFDSTTNGPSHGMVSSYGGTNWYYTPNSGSADVTDTWDMNWSAYNYNSYNTKYTTTTISVAIGSIAAITDTPGNVTGSSDLTGTVNSNNTEFDNNSVTGNLYYADADGTNNSGNPESIKTAPTRGNVSINYGYWTYIPTQGQVGSDTFVVEWTDDLGFKNETTINITVIDTSDVASSISGDTTITLDAMPLDWHSGNTQTKATGTLTITDANGFPENPTGPWIDNTTGSGLAAIETFSRTDANTLSITWSYTLIEEETGDLTSRVNWTDAHGHEAYVVTTVTSNIPAAVDRTVNTSSPNLGAIFNNQSSPTYNLFAGDGDATFEIISTQGMPQIADTYDGYIVSVAESMTLNTYDVTVSIDGTYDWASKATGSPMTGFTETLNIGIKDGFNRTMTALTVNVNIRAFVDTAGSVSLVDPGNGQDNITDMYGQQIITDSGTSSLKLFNPAPQGNGIKAGIVFADVAGVANVSTITLDSVDTNEIEVITGNENGYLTLEIQGKQTTTGSFNIIWSDDLGNTNVGIIAYETIGLPDISGTIVSVKDSDDQTLDAPNGTYIIPASYLPVAFTVSVDDVNGVGPATVISQPSEGSFSIISQGAGYLATYTPPLSTVNLSWSTANMSFKWEDADGNENDTVDIQFQQESPQYDTPWSGSNPESNIDVVIDGVDTDDISFGTTGSSYTRPYQVVVGSTITGKLAINDSNGIPYPGDALIYTQPLLPDGSSGGNLQLIENTTDDLPTEMNQYWVMLPKQSSAGNEAPQTRLFDLSFQAPSVLPAGSDYVDMSINVKVISYRGTGENEIDIEDHESDLAQGIGDTPISEQNIEQNLKIRVYKDAGSYLELEYSEPVDASSIPPHDGTAVAVGNTVQVTGFTQMGYTAPDFGGDSSKQATAGKLIAINQFGPGFNIDWSFAFHGSSNLVHVPSVMPAASNIDGLFYNCVGLTEVVADQWDTSNLTSLESVFQNCTGLIKLYARDWDVSNVTSFRQLFSYTGFTSISDIVGLMPNSPTGWDFSSAESFAQMFQGSSLAGHVNWTNTQAGGNLQNLNHMFEGTNINQATLNSSFDSATSTTGMFENTSISILNAQTPGWNTGNVTNMSDMFKGVNASSISMNNLNVSGVTDASGMFEDTVNLSSTTVGTEVFSSITSPAGFSNMFKNSGVVQNGLDLGNWYTPTLPDVVDDLLGSGVTINSNWTLNLEMGGNPNGYSITPPTVSIVDVQTLQGASSTDVPGKVLSLANYEPPAAAGGLNLDWRRLNDYNQPTKPYMLIKVTNNGETLHFLAHGSHYHASSYNPNAGFQPVGHWNNAYYNINGGNNLYLTLTNVVPISRGDDAEVTFQHTYGEAGSNNVINRTHPSEFVYLDSKPAWVAALGTDLHPRNINLSQWLDLGTPTMAQLESMLPSNATDNVKMTIEVHDGAGVGQPITVVEDIDIPAGEFAELLQRDHIANRLSDDSTMADDTVLTDWQGNLLFETFIPYRFGKTSGHESLTVSSPLGNEVLTADNAPAFIAGNYDSTLPTTGSFQPAPFILSYIRASGEFFDSLNTMIDSCFFPEFEITGFEAGETYTNNTLKQKLAGSVWLDTLIPQSIANNTYSDSFNSPERMKKWHMNGKQPEVKTGWYVPTGEWYVDAPANNFTVSVKTSTKYNDTTRDILYGGTTAGQLNMTTGEYTNQYGSTGTLTRQIISSGINYAEFEWTGNVSKVFIPQILGQMPLKRIFDFDPDGSAGLTGSDRFYIYTHGHPVRSAHNVPSGMKGAIPLRFVDLKSMYDGTGGDGGGLEPIPGFEAHTQAWVDTYGSNDVFAAVPGLTTSNYSLGYNYDDSFRYPNNDQVIFEYADAAKPRKVRIYDELGPENNWSRIGSTSSQWSGQSNVLRTVGQHQPESDGFSFPFALSQNVSFIHTLGTHMTQNSANPSPELELLQGGEWYSNSADQIEIVGTGHKWYYWSFDNTATVITDVRRVAYFTGSPITIQ